MLHTKQDANMVAHMMARENPGVWIEEKSIASSLSLDMAGL